MISDSAHIPTADPQDQSASETPTDIPTQVPASDGNISHGSSPQPTNSGGALRVPMATAATPAVAVGAALETIAEDHEEGQLPPTPHAASPPDGATLSAGVAREDPGLAAGATEGPGGDAGEEREADLSVGEDDRMEADQAPMMAEPPQAEEENDVDTAVEDQHDGELADGVRITY